MSEKPIKDKSVLGSPGQKLCENIDVHWLTPTTHGKCACVAACVTVALLPEMTFRVTQGHW